MNTDSRHSDSKEYKLTQLLNDAKETIISQEHALSRTLTNSSVQGTIISVPTPIDINRFIINDMVSVIDNNDQYYNRIGSVSYINREKGVVKLRFFDNTVSEFYSVGVNNMPKQVKLLNKNDGSVILVSYNNNVYEAWSETHFNNVSVGDIAKLNPQTNQIIEIEHVDQPTGLLTKIIRKFDGFCEIDVNGTKKLIKNSCNGEEGDEIIIDNSGNSALKVVVKATAPKPEIVTWDDIGGMEETKEEIREAIEYPYTYANLYKAYNKKPTKGIVLHGPPGCGKTMLGKAAANALKSLHHNGEYVSSAFNYIKGGELLSKWVGEAEVETRSIFARSRNHFLKHNYPAIIFVDEADSLFNQRDGQGMMNEPWKNTLIAAWLTEMDGFDNIPVITIFATNRMHALDQAILRDGRIDKIIKIPRPDSKTSFNILHGYLKKCILKDDADSKEMAALVIANLTSGHRSLFTVKHVLQSEIFTLKDAISGAMLANLVNIGKSIAIRRDIRNNTGFTGLSLEDMNSAIDVVYKQHAAQNHDFDIREFAQQRNWMFDKISVEPNFNSDYN